MTDVNSRRIAAVVGALVADAAAQPLHWIYNEEKLQSIIGNKEEVEFWESSHNPFYNIPVGLNTCYGDQAFVILKSLVDNKGVNCDSLKSSTYEWFGPKSAYEDPENEETALSFELQSDQPEKDAPTPTYLCEVIVECLSAKPTLPINRPWRHASIKHFLANMEAGKEFTGSDTDEQIDCAVRMVPVCAAYAGHPEMLTRVEEVLRVTQNLDIAISIGLAAARILEQFILHGQTHDALSHVLSDMQDPQRKNPQELDEAVVDLPASFQSALHGALTATGYQEAVRATIKVGGCNASRCGFIGACSAAQFGMDSIPVNWREKTKNYPTFLELAKQLPDIIL